MLGMLINTNLPWAPNTWKMWVDHIVKQRKTFGFKKACMAHHTGNIASASQGFILTQQEILFLKFFFDEMEGKRPEAIRIKDKTYVVKWSNEHQLVAFNGSKYVIVCKSNSMFIVTLSESRSRCEQGAQWLLKMNNRLIEKDF